MTLCATCSPSHNSTMWLKLLIAECGFSMQVDDGAQLELEDGVTFTGGVAALTGAYKATTVGFLMTAADRSNQRELGQVVHRSSSSWLPVGKGQMGAFQNLDHML